ncbi:copper-binding protein [Caulobacter segnis]|uniref:copper-binding protein n=1 Tax=Caulobacter segnis TaxID=88688 RepID=UPI00241008A2|nr:copper-binding protein [Caulobacter segnis]MDG2520277.1 copper-binding protein [Caulobacter segnis]
MKSALIAAAILAAASPAFAQSHDHHAAPAAKPAAAEGVGVVRSVDVKAGKAVIAHEPMPAINWPAMTMSFKVSDKAGLAAVKPGQKVRFTLSGQTVTAIRPY